MMKNIIGMVLGLAVVLAASACSAAENDGELTIKELWSVGSIAQKHINTPCA